MSSSRREQYQQVLGQGERGCRNAEIDFEKAKSASPLVPHQAFQRQRVNITNAFAEPRARESMNERMELIDALFRVQVKRHQPDDKVQSQLRGDAGKRVRQERVSAASVHAHISHQTRLQTGKSFRHSMQRDGFRGNRYVEFFFSFFKNFVRVVRTVKKKNNNNLLIRH